MYGGQLRREPDNYHGYSDHRPDLALLVEGTLKVFDLKVFDPISVLRRRCWGSKAARTSRVLRRRA